MKIKIVLILVIFILGILTCLNPIYPSEQILQHIGTILLMIPLFIDLKKNKLPLIAFIGLSIFIMIHIVGARYIYSYVPYEEWLKSISGDTLDTAIDFKRNHFDRFVHFSFGVLFFPYIYHLVGQLSGLKKAGKILIAWAFIQILSMFYELFEWAITIVMTKDIAEGYNGQQGDIWDAHKDMALAMLGSTIIAFVYLIKRQKDPVSKKSNYL